MTAGIQAQTIPGTASVQSMAAGGVLGKDDFLKMLVMQLRYQDPMNPLKGTEFAAQLAQFSSVEQLANMNTNLEQSIDVNAVLTKSINNALAGTFIGKDVRAVTDTFHYSGSGTVRFGYTLAASADSVVVTVRDGNGNAVRVLRGVPTGKGDQTISWDGKDDRGTAVGAGDYTFDVEAQGADGSTIDARRFVLGTVSSVRFKPEGTVFVIDGIEVLLSNIIEIMKG